jgi:hypothetical protein
MGYDGAIITDDSQGDAKNTDTWVAFEPAQIKSAIGNKGTFDPKNSNILFNREQTKTPEFKKFFGESKVVDKDGEPMVLYHGTDKEFDEFTGGELGSHFGTAEQASKRLDSSVGKPRLGENIIPAYIRINNPIRLSADPGYFGRLSLLGQLVKDKVISEPESKELLSRMDESDKNSAHTGSANERAQRFKLIREYLKSKGYDGITYPNEYEGEGESYIAFDPTQIKSAIGNSGSFDPNDPNILRNREKPPTAKMNNPKFRKWFKGSEVKDENGDPLTLYHGSVVAGTPNRLGISEFDPSYLGSHTGANSASYGFFFSTSPSVAESYVTREPTSTVLGGPHTRLAHAERNMNLWQEGTNHAEAVFNDDSQKWEVKATEHDQWGEPYTYDDGYEYDDEIDAKDAAYELEQEETKKAEDLYEKRQKELDESVKNRTEAAGPVVYPVHLSIKDPLVHDFDGGDYQGQSFSELLEKAERRGNDGALFKNVRDALSGSGEVSDVWIAFKPEQIKSAIGNKGTYSSSDPNILRNREKPKDTTPSAAGQESSLESNTSEIGDGGKSQSTVDRGSTGTTPTTVIPIKGGTQLAAAPIQIPVVPVIKVHTILPHQTTAQVSVPLQTTMGVTPVVTKRILPLSELKVLAAGLNPQRKVSNIKDLIAEANRRNPTKMIP